jgi:biotin-dependent carboxylase-like uncharacterized protein
MATSTLRIERTGQAVVQDLGRPGYAEFGIPANGAADQHAARTASILVANDETAPLVEVTGSELALISEDDLLLAVTGAADHVLLDGHPQPAWQPLHVHRGARVTVPDGRYGLRSYLAVNGTLACETKLGSVAPDPLLGIGQQLLAGDRLIVETRYRSVPGRAHLPLFRLAFPRVILSEYPTLDATPGPELGRMTLGAACLSSRYEVSAQSNNIGLRLLSDPIEQNSTDEILSRGVPVGAIEVPPADGIIVLLRGRLMTAGYPVVGVITTESLDRLGQLRPGDSVAFAFCDVATARQRLRRRHQERQELVEQVRRAFSASGLGELLPSSYEPDAPAASGTA